MQDIPAKKTGLEDCFLAALQRVDPAAHLCVAYSGGRDSAVLLHVAARLAERKLRVIHVNHGLHPDAGLWAEHCQSVCDDLQLPLSILQVSVDPDHSQGLEAAARDARYAALHGAMHTGEVLLTAHHEQDQLETFFLQLFRGAGVTGLAAMPVFQNRQGVAHLRPLLQVPADRVADYADLHQLEWIEDPSNAEDQFDRNYLRHNILPLIKERWPSASRAVSRSARLNAVAAELLTELAEVDLAAGTGMNWVSIDMLRNLTPQRQANALRYLLRSWQLPVPSEAQLNQALKNLLTSQDDRQPLGSWPGVRARRFRDRVWFFSETDDPVASMANAPDEYHWSPGESLDMGRVRGILEAGESNGGGIAKRWFEAPLQVKFRSGGESLRPGATEATRKLKKLLQESDIFPWMRCHIPLVYSGEQLIAVGDLWTDAAFSAASDQQGQSINWRDHAPIRASSGL
jgi:tRNA(Ile)-lysidine synthase